MDIDARSCTNKIKQRNEHDFEAESKNRCLSVAPSELKFTFDSGDLRAQEKIVRVTNYFSKPCPVRFLPLETPYFKIKNTFPRIWLNAGSVTKLNILFAPNENRDYNDVLTICYFNDRTTQVKIFAKMQTNFSFPATVNFGDVPLDRTVYYEIPIHPHAEKEFSFAISPSNGDSCVDVYPRRGRVRPHQKPAIITVIYRPLRYVSMNFQVRIFISDLCETPRVINFYAYTRPGLLREALENVEAEIKRDTRRKKITLSGEVSKPICVRKDKSKESPTKCTSLEKISFKQCDRFPLHALHTVNCVLNWKIRRPIDEYELKGPLNAFPFETARLKAQKSKEFLAKVENRLRETEQAKFRREPKVNYGTSDVDDNQIVAIKMQREQAWNDYKMSRTRSESDALFEQRRTKKIRQRILRDFQKYPNTISSSSRREAPSFHYCKIQPFLQAARKVVLRNRLLKVLSKLRNVTPELIDRFEDASVENDLVALET